jgi:hypothetical protein
LNRFPILFEPFSELPRYLRGYDGLRRFGEVMKNDAVMMFFEVNRCGTDVFRGIVM